MKKFFAILVALTMVLAMSTAAFAVGETGTITVENVKADAVYTAYKIFDLQIVEPDAETSDDAYFYTINNGSVWYDAVNAYTGDGLTLEPYNDYDAEHDVYIVRTDDDFDAVVFAEYLKGYLADHETAVADSATALNNNGTTAVSGDIELGYYFVTSSVGVVAALTSTHRNATIYEKNPFDFDKTEENDNYDLGDSVEYTVSVTIPGTDGYDNTDEDAQHYTYTFTDHMTDGLDFDGNVVVKIVDGADEIVLTPDTDYTVSSTGTHDFTIDFFNSITTAKMQDHKGATLKITYSATLNENAVAVISDNEITLEYGNEYETEEITDDVVLYSSKINIKKYDKNDHDVNLQYAEFVLYKEVVEDDATVTYYYSFVRDAEGNPIEVEWTTDVTKAEKASTDANGEASFIGLADGTYYLKETKAPDGYALLNNPIEVTLDGITAITNQTKMADPAVTDADLTALTHTENVENAKASSLLPSTGGIGTTIFYCVGTVLILGAVVLLVARRRMSGVEVEA